MTIVPLPLQEYSLPWSASHLQSAPQNTKLRPSREREVRERARLTDNRKARNRDRKKESFDFFSQPPFKTIYSLYITYIYIYIHTHSLHDGYSVNHFTPPSPSLYTHIFISQTLDLILLFIFFLFFFSLFTLMLNCNHLQINPTLNTLLILRNPVLRSAQFSPPFYAFPFSYLQFPPTPLDENYI